MESEKKKICPKCKHEDGSGQNNLHDMNPEHFCKCSIRSIGDRTKQIIQVVKKERLFGDKRRILQSAHATFYRIRVV